MSISGQFNDEENFEQYIEELLEKDKLHNIFLWKGKYYIYYIKPSNEEE
jgi:hypothetical protein